MGRQAATYKKIPGRWLAPFTRRTLWQGPDHLLWVEKTMMQEHYRRFYFKDIQAIIVRGNRRQHLWTLFWAFLLLVTGSLALPSLDTPEQPQFFVPAFFVLLWSIGLLINLLKGPCCEFYLQTAVQLERLSNMVRVRAVLKVADRIKALAEDAQGKLPGSAMAGKYAAVSSEARRLQHVDTDMAYSPVWHWALFSVLLCQGILGGLQLWLQQSWLVVLSLVAMALALVLVIVALVRCHRQIKGAMLSMLTWVSLVFAVAHGVSAYGLYIFGSVRNPEYSYNAAALFKVFLDLYLEDNAFITTLVMGFTVGALTLGGVGLIATALRADRGKAPA